jgi:transposase
VVDARGLPLIFSLTPGQANDKPAALPLLERLEGVADVVADRGYDSDALISTLAQQGIRAHIPSTRSRKTQRSVERDVYRQRNLVERYFNKLKHFRRCATRYAKLARNFRAAIALANTRLWTRFYESTT